MGSSKPPEFKNLYFLVVNIGFIFNAPTLKNFLSMPLHVIEVSFLIAKTQCRRQSKRIKWGALAEREGALK